MSEEAKHAAGTEPQETVSQAAEELTRSVTELVGAVFGVGAAVAKSAAQATAGGRPVPEPKAPQGPLNLIIHYGLTAATNIVRTVVSAAPVMTASATAAPSQGAAAASPPAGPSVTVGATLRMPLSIENPGVETMESLEFRCLRVDALQVGSGQKLGVSNVRLAPSVLSVAAKDFEKLTVFVDTTPLTAPGTYRAAIGVGAGTFETAVQFEVLAAQGA